MSEKKVKIMAHSKNTFLIITGSEELIFIQPKIEKKTGKMGTKE